MQPNLLLKAQTQCTVVQCTVVYSEPYVVHFTENGIRRDNLMIL